MVEKEKNISRLAFTLNERIQVKNAAFSWDGRHNLFSNVNFEIPVGRVTSLWGPSGSGKSTIVSLLQRKYNLNIGNIFFDDINANEIELSNYRMNVGVLPQHIKVFNGTLADNIILGREINDVQQLVAKVQETNLTLFLDRFENGLYTLLGENGRKLSGGEMQMLALIRALLFKPKLLIIDEGLSGIDFEIEAVIYERIYEYAKYNAVLLITHNLANLLKTDYLYVLKEGTIIEHGSPGILVQNGSVYGNSVKRQYSYFFNNRVLKNV